MKNIKYFKLKLIILIIGLHILSNPVYAEICQPNNSLTFDASELDIDQVAKKYSSIGFNIRSGIWKKQSILLIIVSISLMTESPTLA